MSFAGDIQKFSQKTGIRLDQVTRKVCLDLTRDLVKLTPVDTGMARANYFFGLERIRSTDTAPSKNGSPSIARAAAFATTLKAGGVFYITNNLPYILQITQYGTSTQSAPGSLTKLVSDWQRRVDRVVRSL